MKEWKKATVVAVKAEQLARHIQAAARSYQCARGDSR